MFPSSLTINPQNLSLFHYYIFPLCSEPTLETQQAQGLINDAEKCKLLLSRCDLILLSYR